MTELPEVRRADCGHGFLSIDTLPAAMVQNGIHLQPVYLCRDCRHQIAGKTIETKSASGIETKALGPTATQTVEFTAKKSSDFGQALSPADRGRVAALAGDPRKVPDDLGHPRGAPAREWYAAYDAAKAEMPPEAPGPDDG